MSCRQGLFKSGLFVGGLALAITIFIMLEFWLGVFILASEFVVFAMIFRTYLLWYINEEERQ